MMEEKYDDTFLARWLANELTEEEKIRFEASAEYHDYVQIVENADLLEAPSFDAAKVLQAIQEEKQQATPKTRRLTHTVWYAAAAVVLLFVGFTYFFANTDTIIETDYGNQQVVTLPDGSEVFLNARSAVTFNKDTWAENRQISLVGEAYFNVKKGKKFVVTTNTGTVEVLGTAFNVLTDKNLLEVKCHEGKVKVSSLNNASVILTKGDAFTFINEEERSWNFNTNELTWRDGESNFKEIPLATVIAALQDQYEIKFISENIDTAQRFTGTFSHKNLKLALRTVFVPMEISYTFKDEKVIVLKKAK